MVKGCFKKLLTGLLLSICFGVSAQTLTATYVEMVDSADYYIGKQMWTDAENMIIKALKHEPANKSNFVLWSNLGIVRENQENFQGAVEAYTIGLSSAPKSTVLLTNRARAFLALDKPMLALQDLETALATDSTLQWPIKMRGLILATIGKNEEALKSLLSYEEKFGDDFAVSEVLGDIYAGKSDYEKSAQAYRKALDMQDDEQLLNKALLTAYAYGKLDEWEERIRDGIKNHPRDAILYLLRAMLNKQKYQTDAYESDLKTALDLGVDKALYEYLTKSKL